MLLPPGITLPSAGTGPPLYASDSEMDLTLMLVTSSWHHLAISCWHRSATARYVASDLEVDLTLMLVTSSWHHLAVS